MVYQIKKHNSKIYIESAKLSYLSVHEGKLNLQQLRPNKNEHVQNL